MKQIANFLFEGRMLKEIPRSGYHFLGKGNESIAEHSFMVTLIAYVMSELVPDVNAQRLISMCLLHDLPEARTGDLNSVQKRYVNSREDKALSDLTENIPFATSVKSLATEFNKGQSQESQLAHDADQLALLLDLKTMSDMGHLPADKWIPSVKGRMKTEIGMNLAQQILNSDPDEWWMQAALNR